MTNTCVRIQQTKATVKIKLKKRKVRIDIAGMTSVLEDISIESAEIQIQRKENS